MKDKKAALLEKTQTKEAKITQLEAQLKHLEGKHAQLKQRFEENYEKLKNHDAMIEEHEKSTKQLEHLRKTTLLKKDFYKPEPDYYQNELLNF